MKKIPFGAWQHILLRPIREQPSVRGETARHAVDGATSSALLHCPRRVYLEETLAVFASHIITMAALESHGKQQEL